MMNVIMIVPLTMLDGSALQAQKQSLKYNMIYKVGVMDFKNVYWCYLIMNGSFDAARVPLTPIANIDFRYYNSRSNHLGMLKVGVQDQKVQTLQHISVKW